MQKFQSYFFVFVFVFVFFASLFLIDNASAADSGIVQCGKTAGSMCNLCNLIEGLNTVIQFVMNLAIFVGLAVFTIAGAMYIISAGSSGMIDMAKSAMKNSAIGFIVIFSAWLIINYSMQIMGTKKDLGIKVTSWGKFVCTDKAAQHN